MKKSQISTVAPSDFRTVKSSQIVLKELMIPSYANFGGKVHGGVILSLMDKIAYTAAASHSRSYCVTASVDSVNFLSSVDVGDLVTLMASVNFVGRSSMEVGIKVFSEDFKRGIDRHTNTSYFTMVAIDETTRQSIPVPGLILEEDIEVERFIWGKYRKQNKLAYKMQFQDLKANLNMKNEKNKLREENCFIKAL